MYTITKRKFHGVILAYKPSKSANLWLHPVKTPPATLQPSRRNLPPVRRPVCPNNNIIHTYIDTPSTIIYYYNNKRRNIVTTYIYACNVYEYNILT